MTLWKMQNLVYEWVNFSESSKIWGKILETSGDLLEA